MLFRSTSLFMLTTHAASRLAHRAKHSCLIYAGMALDAWTLRTEIQAQGHRLDDPANKKERAGYALTKLSASWKINKDESLQARVNNLLDQKYEQLKDYGTLGRNAMLNLRWQQ
jgi:vitamin B12 transporter